MRWHSSKVPCTAEGADVAAPAGQLLRLALGDEPLRIQHDHIDPGLVVERGRDRAAGVAGGCDQDRELPGLVATDALHGGGQEARAEILERAGRPVEQLEHRRRLRRLFEGHQRCRKVESFTANRTELAGERIARSKNGSSSRSPISGISSRPSNWRVLK